MYFGYQVAFGRFGGEVTKYADLDQAISSARTAEQLSFGEQISRMFSVGMPEGVDLSLLADTMAQWKEFWVFPALMAGVIAVLFLVTFWDRVEVADDAS